MKKDTEHQRKYVTLESGVDFRTIARIMSENGWRMNHATARNQLILAMQNLLTYVAVQVKGPKMKASEIDSLLKDQTIHDHLGDILYLAHKGDVENEEQND
jgi:hypothetical protein